LRSPVKAVDRPLVVTTFAELIIGEVLSLTVYPVAPGTVFQPTVT
jgi:hypothetical protein